MSSLKTVTKNTFLYTISSVLQRASSIIFFPIFSFYLTKGDYGIQSVMGSITSFIVLATGLELTRTATRLIYDGENREERIKEIYGSYIFTIFLSNVIMGAFLLYLGPYLLKPFLNDIKFSPYMVYTIYTLPFLATYNLFKNYLQATHQGFRFIKVDLVFFALNVGFNLYFVIVFKMGAAGIILSTVVASVVMSIYAYFSFFRKTYIKFNWKILLEGLHFSLPLIPYILLGNMTEISDKMVLNTLKGKEVSGLYYIATMIATMFNIFRESSNQALNPWFFENYNKQDKPYTNKVLYTVFAGLAIVAIGISFFSYEILVTLSRNKSLIAGYKYTPIITNTALVIFLSQIYNMPTFYYKKQVRFLFITSLIACPVDIGLSFALIPHLGPMGAALANFGAMSVLTIVCGILSYRSGYRIKDYYFVIVIAISFSLSLLALVDINDWAFLNYWTFLALKIIIMLTLLGGYYIYLNRHFNLKEFVIAQVNRIPFFKKGGE